MNCTIYKITNLINNKIYIGQTWQKLERRFSAHNRKNSGCHHIRNAIQKYGQDNFSIEVLAFAPDQIGADWLESKYIEMFCSMDRTIGYNLREGGSGGKIHEETKKKMSLAKQNVSLDTRKKISLARLGKPSTSSGKFKKGQTSTNKGKKASKETKKKMSDNWHLYHTLASIEKAAAAKRGKSFSKEHKDKIAKASLGNKSTTGRTWQLIDGKHVYNEVF